MENYAAIEHSKYNQVCIVDWRGGHGPGELPRGSGIKVVNHQLVKFVFSKKQYPKKKKDFCLKVVNRIGADT